MGTSHVVSGLVAKYQEITRDIAEQQERIKLLLDQQRCLVGSIRVFDPNYEIETIKKKRTYSKCTMFEHGEVQRLILEALTIASSPRTSGELADSLIEVKGLEPTPPILGNCRKRVGNALRRLEQRRIVVQPGSRDGSMTWVLA